jgi:hypothetical protein
VLAATVMTRIHAAVGVDLPLRTLFKAPDITSLAPRLEAQLFSRAGNGGIAHAAVGGQREEIVL